jgi:hypothetical protein
MGCGGTGEDKLELRDRHLLMIFVYYVVVCPERKGPMLSHGHLVQLCRL